MISRFGRTPLGAFYRSPLGVFTNVSNNIIDFSDWRVIKQASPTTVFSNVVSGNNIQGYSDVDDDYDSSSDGLKSVGKLSRVMKAKTSRNGILVLDYPNVGGAGSVITGTLSVLTGVAFSGWSLKAKVRIRPILTDFDQTLSTWDLWQDTPPSLGSALEEFTAFGNVALNDPSGSNAVNLNTFGGMPQFIVPRTVDIYGFFVDVKYIHGSAGGSGSTFDLSSCIGKFDVKVDNTFIYLI